MNRLIGMNGLQKIKLNKIYGVHTLKIRNSISAKKTHITLENPPWNFKICHYITVVKPETLHSSETLSFQQKVQTYILRLKNANVKGHFLNHNLKMEKINKYIMKYLHNILHWMRLRRTKFFGHMHWMNPNRTTFIIHHMKNDR